MSGRLSFKNSIGRQNIAGIQEQSLALKDAPPVVNVKLEKIRENPDNVKIYSKKEEDLTNLKASIESNGFLGSIIIFDLGNDTYEICSGHRRKKAMEELGKDSIPSTILPIPEDETKKADLLLACNQNDREKTPMDRAREIQYYELKHKNDKKTPGVNMRNILSSFFNISPSKVYRYSNLLELSENLQALAEIDGFPWHALGDAKNLSREKQEELYRRIKDVGTDSITGTNIKEMIGELSGENKELLTNESPSKKDSEKTGDPVAKEDRKISDYEATIETGTDKSGDVTEKKEKYSKTETGRLKLRLSAIADLMDFNNEVLIEKGATKVWYDKFSEAVQELGRYV